MFGAFLRRLFGGGPATAPAVDPAPPVARDPFVEFRPHALTRTFRISGPPGDQSVLEELRHSHTFEPHIVGLLARVVTPETVALDVGANLGVLAVVIGALATRGRVLAVEAGGVAYRHLRETLAANDIRNVETLQRAVYRESGLTLHLNTSSAFLAGGHLTADGAAGDGTESVETITIDDWVARYALARLDLVKMDIEGAELDALSGARQTLGRFKPALLIECNAIVMRRFHRTSSRDLFEAVSTCYPHIYLVPEASRDGTVVPLSTPAQLQEALALGRGNEDLFCTVMPADLPLLPFDTFIGALRDAPDASEIVIEPSYTLSADPAVLVGPPGSRLTTRLRLANAGPQRLASHGRFPVHVSYHLRSDGDELVQFDGVRTPLPAPIGPGQAAEIDVAIELPASAGQYRAQLTLVQEGMAWLEDLHAPMTEVTLQVREGAP